MRAVLAVRRTIAKRSLVDADVVDALKAFHAMADRARRVEGRVRRLSSTQEHERLEQAEPATRPHTPSAAR